MHPIVKKLAGQTAIYGLSTIVGRFLNYLLLPIHTNVFKDPAQYGVITEFYAYTAFTYIIFTYGMETAFFRFVTSEPDKKKVYDTSLVSLLFSSIVLSGIMILVAQPLATGLRYADHSEYVTWFALIMGLDAIVAIPFARLRQESRPLRFAFFKVLNIGINVGCNLLFLLLIPYILSHDPSPGMKSFIMSWYNPAVGVGYVFIANLIASAVTVLLLGKYFTLGKLRIDFVLWKRILQYSMPLIIVGLAGMVDEMLSRAILKYRLPVSPERAMHELGVFGANYKLAVLMTLFVQAFRMAAEPFFFNESQKTDARVTYARTMNFFVIGGAFIFLGVTLFMDVFKAIFISKNYYEGIRVVPILLMAQLFLGVYYNLTIWYKLTNRTNTGALVAIYGAVITLILNWWLIPQYGYVGSSWVTLFCYGTMVIISFFLGQKYYPVPYDLRRFFFYISLAVAIFFLNAKINSSFFEGVEAMKYFTAALFMGAYLAVVYVIEKGKVGFLKPI